MHQFHPQTTLKENKSTHTNLKSLMIALSLMATPAALVAQEASQAETTIVAAAEEAPWLKVYFPSGSASISADQAATLDRAVRTFREGDPIVMIVAGGADSDARSDSRDDQAECELLRGRPYALSS